MRKPKLRKNQVKGNVDVDIFDLDSYQINSMDFFDQFIPEGCRVTNVRIYAEYGYYSEGDTARFIIDWEKINETKAESA